MSSTNQSTRSGRAAEPKTEAKPTKAFMMEEDDEFEDFPVEDWNDAESDTKALKANMWEESWDDDDDTNEDFSAQLKAELKKVQEK